MFDFSIFIGAPIFEADTEHDLACICIAGSKNASRTQLLVIFLERHPLSPADHNIFGWKFQEGAFY